MWTVYTSKDQVSIKIVHIHRSERARRRNDKTSRIEEKFFEKGQQSFS